MYSACSASVQVWAHTAPLGQLTFIAFIMMPTIHVIVRDLDSLEFSSFIMFMVPLNKINILCGLKCISLLLFIFLPILVNTCSTLNLISIFPSVCGIAPTCGYINSSSNPHIFRFTLLLLSHLLLHNPVVRDGMQVVLYNFDIDVHR